MVRYIHVPMSPRELHGRSVVERITRLRDALPARYPHVLLSTPIAPDSYIQDLILLGDIDADTAQEANEVVRYIEHLLGP